MVVFPCLAMASAALACQNEETAEKGVGPPEPVGAGRTAKFFAETAIRQGSPFV
jgi:hypothetical protein